MSASPPLPITLLIIARNEASAIGRCLDSVPFAAEKLVVDSGSTDGTQEVATRHGARVVHQDWLGFGPQRNFASTQASHDWILALDADEALSAGTCARKCRRACPDSCNRRSPARFCGVRPGTWARRCAGIGRWWASAWVASIIAAALAGPMCACTNRCVSTGRRRRSGIRSFI